MLRYCVSALKKLVFVHETNVHYNSGVRSRFGPRKPRNHFVRGEFRKGVCAYVCKGLGGAPKCRFDSLPVGQIDTSPEILGLEKGPKVHFEPLAVGQTGLGRIFGYELRYVRMYLCVLKGSLPVGQSHICVHP